MADRTSLVLFSGTNDRLQAAATLVSGAAAMGAETHVFLMFWGVNAFRKDVIGTTPPVSPEYGEASAALERTLSERQVPPWHELLRMAKDVGDVRIHACSLTMDLLGLEQDDLDSLVDDVIGVAAWTKLTEGAGALFI